MVCDGHHTVPRHRPPLPWRLWSWTLLSAAQNKTAAPMVMRNAAYPRLSTPLKGRHMSPRISESPFTWLSLTGISAPPRNPNNNNDEDEEDEDEDEEDDNNKREPAVIREPDEDE